MSCFARLPARPVSEAFFFAFKYDFARSLKKNKGKEKFIGHYHLLRFLVLAFFCGLYKVSFSRYFLDGFYLIP